MVSAAGRRILRSCAVAALGVTLLAGCGDDGDSPGAEGSSSSVAPATGSDSVAATSEGAASEAVSEPVSDAPEPAPEGTPECAAVWVEGKELPRRYRGCAEGGLLVEPDSIGCSSGQAIVRLDDRYWAVRGGEIAQSDGALLDSDDYRDDLATCRG